MTPFPALFHILFFVSVLIQSAALYSLSSTVRTLCVVIITYDKHHELIAQARKTWLRGVKTVVYSNKEDASAGTSYAPDHWGTQNVHWQGNNAGDGRWLYALQYANTSCRPFSWMLLLDDDTYMVIPQVARFVQNLNFNTPLYLGLCQGHCDCQFQEQTDVGDLGPFCCRSPASQCRTNRSSDQRCYTTRVTDADGNEHWVFDRQRWFHPETAPTGAPQLDFKMPKTWHYGGAGAIISVGVFDVVPKDDWAACTRKTACSGSDVGVSGCILATANIALTDASQSGLTQRTPDLRSQSPLWWVQQGLSFHRVDSTAARKLFLAECSLGMRRHPTPVCPIMPFPGPSGVD